MSIRAEFYCYGEEDLCRHYIYSVAKGTINVQEQVIVHGVWNNTHPATTIDSNLFEAIKVAFEANKMINGE